MQVYAHTGEVRTRVSKPDESVLRSERLREKSHQRAPQLSSAAYLLLHVRAHVDVHEQVQVSMCM